MKSVLETILDALKTKDMIDKKLVVIEKEHGRAVRKAAESSVQFVMTGHALSGNALDMLNALHASTVRIILGDDKALYPLHEAAVDSLVAIIRENMPRGEKEEKCQRPACTIDELLGKVTQQMKV